MDSCGLTGLVNVDITENHNVEWENELIINGHVFNSYVTNYQRVS